MAADSSIRVERVGIALPFGTPDTVWLTKVGQREWIPLMLDKRVRRRPLEKKAIHDAKVGAFIFTGGNASAQDTADAVIPLVSKMARLFADEQKPFVYTFGKSKVLTKVDV